MTAPRERKVYLYRLAIEYPREAECRCEQVHDHDPLCPMRYGWPRERLFLSPSSAYRRASRLTSMGCTVHVERSHRVTWPW